VGTRSHVKKGVGTPFPPLHPCLLRVALNQSGYENQVKSWFCATWRLRSSRSPSWTSWRAGPDCVQIK